MSKKHQKSTGSILSALAVGLAVAMASALVVCAVAAALLSGGRIAEETVDYAAALSLLLGTVTGCLSGAGKMPLQRLFACILIGVVFYLFLFVMGTALFEGGILHAGITALLILGGSFAAGLLQIGGKKQKPFRKRKGRIGTIVHIA